jgi:Spy/CpxP family protein refolding chaperone
MLRNFAIALVTLATVAFATDLQAQGQRGQGQGQGRGGRGMGGMMGGPGGGPGGGMLMLLMNEAVQKEIELTADQKEQFQKIRTESQEAMRTRMGDMQNLSQEERRAKMQEMRKEMEETAAKTQKKVEGILLPHQLKRIKEIQVQMQGLRALANPEVAKELGLTEEQQAKIKAANEEAMKAMQEMFQGGMRNLSQEERTAAREKMDKAQKDTETKLMEVLTAEQKEKLEKMKGEKFDTSTLMRGFGGGQGGNRRGNRGGGNNPPAPVN